MRWDGARVASLPTAKQGFFASLRMTAKTQRQAGKTSKATAKQIPLRGTTSKNNGNSNDASAIQMVVVCCLCVG